MYVDPIEGEQRDGVVARGLKIVSCGVAPWPGDRCSDHEPLHAVIESGELFITLNINGASLSPREGRTFDGSDVTPELLAAFREVWSMPVGTFFEPLAGRGARDATQDCTWLFGAGRRWSSSTWPRASCRPFCRGTTTCTNS